MSRRISITRIALYIRALYLQRFAIDIIQYIVIAAIFVISSLLWALAIKASLFAHPPFFIPFLLTTIYGLTLLLSVSRSFRPFHNRKTSSLIMTIPASSFEKYCALLLFHFCTHVLIVGIIMALAKVLVCLSAEFVLGSQHDFGSWVNSNLPIIGVQNTNSMLDIIRSTTKFIGATSIAFCYFFLSAVLFKKNQFIKAVLIIWGLYVLQTIITFVVEIVELSKIYGKNSPHFLEYSTKLPYHENVLIIGGIICIIIGYIRFSRMQYR